MVACDLGVIEAAFNETENELSKHKVEPSGGGNHTWKHVYIEHLIGQAERY